MYWSALVIGLLGNFHCMGMCGPIALSLPIGNLKTSQKIGRILLYNFGRVLAYGLLGGIIGVFGLGLRYVGIVQTLSIVSGILLIVFGLFMIPKFSVRIGGMPQRISQWTKRKMGHYLQQKNWSTLFFVGFFNGLLPCGLVYAGLIGSLAAGSWMGGVGYMMLFGVGTLPLMLLLPFVGSVISMRARNTMRKIVPYSLIFFGILFVVRGSNLGIPYLSPKIEMHETVTGETQAPPVMHCH